MDRGTFAVVSRVLAEPLLLTDQHGVIISASRQAGDIFGRGARELEGTSLASYLSGPADQLVEHLRLAARTSSAIPGTLRFRKREDEVVALRSDTARASVPGEPVMLLMRLRPHAAAVREFMELRKQIDALAAEVDRRQRAERLLQAQNEREREARTAAEKADRLKGEFLATVSHELRTPLTSILGWSRLLRESGSGAELEEGLATIESSARSQIHLVDDLLDVSRISIGKMKLRMEPVDLVAVIQSAVATVRPLASVRRVEVRTELPQEFPMVPGDSQRLHQIVWNLLTNAIKFSPVGSSVRVLLEFTDENARISVTDEGEGIDPEFLPRLFTRFSQAEPTLTRTRGGLGLGLSIVKDLVELHGGRVDVESERGKGATFSVELPLDETADPQNPGTQSVGLALDGSELAGVVVLVIEDDDATRTFLRALLHRAGATVSTASSMETGLERYRKHRPSVVLCDLGLGGATGYDLLRAILNDGGDPPPLAIAIGACMEEHYDTEAISAGFHSFLAKPVEPELLLDEIRSRLSRGSP